MFFFFFKKLSFLLLPGWQDFLFLCILARKREILKLIALTPAVAGSACPFNQPVGSARNYISSEK